jgi:small subunit ribosomal protein S16
MVKLKLARFGAKKQPYYRVVAADAHGKREGRFIELLGTYDPRKDPPAVALVTERVQYWLSVGAQPTGSVGRLIQHNLAKPAAEPKAAPAAPKAPKAAKPKAAKPAAKAE